jgi:hypothetical protein
MVAKKSEPTPAPVREMNRDTVNDMVYEHLSNIPWDEALDKLGRTVGWWDEALFYLIDEGLLPDDEHANEMFRHLQAMMDDFHAKEEALPGNDDDKGDYQPLYDAIDEYIQANVSEAAWDAILAALDENPK